MSFTERFAYLRRPLRDHAPPAWFKALHVYPNAPWDVRPAQTESDGAVVADDDDDAHPESRRPVIACIVSSPDES